MVYQNASTSTKYTYEWDTKLASTLYFQLYGQFGLLHGQNNYVNTSIEAAIEVYSRTINSVKDKSIAPQVLAELYARKGCALNEIGESEIGLADILEASSIYRKIGDSLNYYWCSAMIGNCYRQQLSFEKAKNQLETAITNLERFGNTIQLLDAYIYYSEYVFLKKDFENVNTAEAALSIKQLDNALQIAEKLNNRVYLGLIYKSIGDINVFNRKYKEALIPLQKSINIFEQTNTVYYKLNAQLTMGMSLLAQHKYNETVTLLLPVAELAAANGWFVILHKTYSTLGSCYYALGDHSKGALYGGRAFTFWKHIANNKRKFEMDAKLAEVEKDNQKLVALEKTLDLNRKTKQRNWLIGGLILISITLSAMLFLFYKLQKSKRELEKQHETVKQTANKNELLLQELHHRVKNNLQFILSIFELEIDANKKLDKKDSLEEMSRRITAMALVHELLYDQVVLETVPVKEYITELIMSLEEMVRNKRQSVKFNIKLDEVKLDVKQCVAVGMIISELVSNSIKHAFKNHDNPVISVELCYLQHSNSIKLNVADNGSGFVNDPESRKGMGFRLVQIFTNELKGKYNIETNNCFSFNFEFSPYKK